LAEAVQVLNQFPDINFMAKSVTCSSIQGLREYQEDYYFFSRIEEPGVSGWLLAIMDGHRGKEVAEFCAKEIGRIFKISDAGEAEEILCRLVAELNSKTVSLSAGSTLSIALILENQKKVFIAVLGDSPVLVLDKNKELHISPEHNVRSNAKERALVEKRGGVYLDGYVYTPDGEHGLQLSRAFGDANLGEIISREPDIYTVSDPEWVLVASDGVFDPGHEHFFEFLEGVKHLALRNCEAEDIIVCAEQRGLKDNATALVWRSRPKWNLIDKVLRFLQKLLKAVW